MWTVLLFLGVANVLTGAEQVPCRNDISYCRSVQSVSIINNQAFCCESGFTLQWINHVINGETLKTCICNRSFYETDCIEGQTQCHGATSLMSNGLNIKCCKNGDIMNSFSNSVINGVRADFCKCTRYFGNSGFRQMSSAIRPMTEAEKVEMINSMSQMSNELNNGMGHMGLALAQSLGSLGMDSFDFDRRNMRPISYDNYANKFLELLGRSIKQGTSQSEVSNKQVRSTATNDKAQTTVAKPNSVSDVRRRGLQELEQRLQENRQVQPAEKNLGFLDRRSQSPLIVQLMSPGFWLPASWRRMFATDHSRRYDSIMAAKNITAT